MGRRDEGGVGEEGWGEMREERAVRWNAIGVASSKVEGEVVEVQKFDGGRRCLEVEVSK